MVGDKSGTSCENVTDMNVNDNELRPKDQVLWLKNSR